MKKTGLGKGLDALFADNLLPKQEEKVEEDLFEKIHKIKIIEIEPNRDQPRRTFDEEALDELASSIKTYGVLQPIIVNKKEDIEYQERLIEIESNNKPLESLHSPIFYDDQFPTQCMKYINCTETKTGFLCWNFSVLTKNKYVAEYIIRTTSLDEAAYMFDAISCCFSN